MKTTRRDFLKTAIGGLGAAIVGGVIAKNLLKGAEFPAVSPGKTSETGEKISYKVDDDPKRHWGFLIDLSKCNGCEDQEIPPDDPAGERFQCSYACRISHYYLGADPPMYWIRVYKLKENPRSPEFWFPKPCMNCQNPPCHHVCPTGATFVRKDGTVLINRDICIGCRICMAACPYETRFFWFNDPPHFPETDNIEFSPDFMAPHHRGTTVKCDYCVHNAYKGALPHCVPACPRGALYFGDLNEDAVSNYREVISLSQALREKGGFRYKEEDGTNPSVWYLPPAIVSGQSQSSQLQLNIEISDPGSSTESTEVNVQATTDDGSLLRKTEVIVRLETRFGPLVVGEGLTDSDGIFSCSFERPVQEEFTIEAELIGAKQDPSTVVKKVVR